MEGWLRGIPHGRLRNSATRGRAVRALLYHEVEEILRLGTTDATWNTRAEESGDPCTPSVANTRIRQLVTRLSRSSRFRRDVLAAYGGRCAVSGLSANGIDGLIEAAHIRGAGQPEFGPDQVTNGIALTPTLHRLFDRHLFSLRYEDGQLVIVTSKRLTVDMVQDPITESRLNLQQGQRVRLPSDATDRPRREFVDFHRRLLRS